MKSTKIPVAINIGGKTILTEGAKFKPDKETMYRFAVTLTS